MYSSTALVHKNIDRARHWLPYCHPKLRDLIALLPAFFCEGHPSIGTYGHKSCTTEEYHLLHNYLGKRPDIPVGRLPDRIGIDSLIVCARPSLSNEYFSSVLLICRPRTESSPDEIEEKAQEIARIYRRHGISLTCVIKGGTLDQLLVYEIMRTGIVIAGKQPITRTENSSDSRTFIGEVPRLITDSTRVESHEWNPFQCFLDQKADEFINSGDYPAPLSIPGSNPFIIPYLHILHRYDENMDSESIEKVRSSISNLYTPFPPTHEAMQALNKAWNMTGSYRSLEEMSFDNGLLLRKWLIPMEENELPVFSWPPPEHMALPAARLCQDKGLWSIREAGQYRHSYPWVVLTWGVVAGLINSGTQLSFPSSLLFRRDIKKRLLALHEEIAQGAEIIVPEDHTKGSIQFRCGRFFFSNTPFAILEKGNKYSLELFESIKKKALLDDIDLDKYEKG
ncbi:MAG TPA: hypothetical protein PLV78_02205 [Deltaproteobacteria bacterium]|nr:hypothetical protein [Deltaproteobacteria bacterium]